MPEVSIITPLYNAEYTIKETINSVQAQTFGDWELLLIDDCSTDKTVDIVKEFINSDSRIKLICRKWNAGPAVTRNRGIQEAKGRFIAFLDADDLWHQDKLRIQLEFMKKQDCGLSYTSYQKINQKGKTLGIVHVPPLVSYTNLLKTNSIGCLTAIYDTSQLGKVYMPNISKRQDLGLWLKIMKLNAKALGVDEVLAYYRIGAKGSVSANKILAAKYQWRIYREVEHIPIFNAVLYFINYLCCGFLKKYSL